MPEQKKETKLERGRGEVAEWKADELAKKTRGEPYDPHAEEIDPGVLFEDEIDLWNAWKEDKLSLELFSKYNERAQARQRLEAMLINKFGHKQLEELRQRKENA